MAETAQGVRVESVEASDNMTPRPAEPSSVRTCTLEPVRAATPNTAEATQGFRVVHRETIDVTPPRPAGRSAVRAYTAEAD